MPNIDKIDSFKTTINFLANEEKWREDRGEVIDEIYPEKNEDPVGLVDLDSLEDETISDENNDISDETDSDDATEENSDEPNTTDNLDDINSDTTDNNSDDTDDDFELPDTNNLPTFDDDLNQENVANDSDNISDNVDNIEKDETSSDDVDSDTNENTEFDNLDVPDDINLPDLDDLANDLPNEDIADEPVPAPLDSETDEENPSDELDGLADDFTMPELDDLTDNLEDDLPNEEPNDVNTDAIDNDINPTDDLDNLEDDLPNIEEDNNQIDETNTTTAGTTPEDGDDFSIETPNNLPNLDDNDDLDLASNEVNDTPTDDSINPIDLSVEDIEDNAIPKTDDVTLPDDIANDVEIANADKDDDILQMGNIDPNNDEDFIDPTLEEATDESISEIKVGDVDSNEDKKHKPTHNTNSDKFSLTDKELERILNYLNKMPKNLKLAILDIFTDEEVSPQYIQLLCDKLLVHTSFVALANLIRDITGETITIPKAYQKSSGLDYERRQQSLSYIFFTYHWKPLKQFMVIIIFLWVIFMTTFYYIYRPIQAEIFYAKGLKSIEDKKFAEANNYFNKGLYGWHLGAIPVPGIKSFATRWFLEYIEEFINKQQFLHAKTLFENLINIFPDSSAGYLAYGTILQKRTLYEQADTIYNKYLFTIKKDDKAIMLAKGDNLLDWANIEPSKYPLANRAYSDVLSLHGESPELNARFLNYAILAKVKDMIWYYSEYFTKNPDELKDSQILANLASYYIDTEQFSKASTSLNKAIKLNFNNPSVHFQFAKYYKFLGDLVKERKSLDLTKEYLYIKKSFSRRDLDMSIETRTSLAKVDIIEENLEGAKKNLLEAIDIYEESIERRVIGIDERLGKLYKDAGDLYLHYYDNEDVAEYYYSKAINYYTSPDLDYSLGLVEYNKGELDSALERFYNTYNVTPDKKSILFALGTIFAKRGTYKAAESFYKTLALQLEDEKISFYDISPQSDMNALLLATYLIKTYNNLGVVYYNLSLTSANKQEYIENSYDAFNKSTEAWDYVNREVKTLKRSLDTSKPQANQALIYNADNQTANNLELFNEIPKTIFTKDYDWAK